MLGDVADTSQKKVINIRIVLHLDSHAKDLRNSPSESESLYAAKKKKSAAQAGLPSHRHQWSCLDKKLKSQIPLKTDLIEISLPNSNSEGFPLLHSIPIYGLS